MMTINIEKPPLNALAHFGVPGMKWGVRKEEKAAKRYDIPEKKSGHRIRLEAKYIKKGASNDEAEQMAAKRIRGEKIALGILGAAAVAGAAYTTYREIGKRNAGVMLEAGKELHYINALGDKADLNRRLYTSFEKSDTEKYKGLLATALRKNAENTTIYDTVLKTTEDIKAPSHKEAAKLYTQFTRGMANETGYKFFNRRLVSEWDSDESRKFVELLKSKGYNAILDSNDQFLSGYNAKKPLILFNAASQTVKTGQSVVDEQLSKKLNAKHMSIIYSKQLLPIVGIGAAIVAGVNAKNTHDKVSVVNSYFKNNPKTNLSYGEVYNAVKTNTDIYGATTYKIDNSKLKKGS